MADKHQSMSMGGFKAPSSSRARGIQKLEKANLNLFDSENAAKTKGVTKFGSQMFPSPSPSVISRYSALNSGANSPNNSTTLSYATSVLNSECKAILDERLYQL